MKKEMNFIMMKKTGDLQECAKARSIDISQDDKLIAIGFHDGTLKIFDTTSYQLKKYITDRKRWISEIKFSPDNTMFAVGSHDDLIDVYTLPNFTKKNITKSSSFIYNTFGLVRKFIKFTK